MEIVDANIVLTNKSVLQEALEIYHTKNVDFIDSILIASNHVLGASIHTFDKKIKSLCR